MPDDFFAVRNDDHIIYFIIPEVEANALQDLSPFSFDRRIWLELCEQGVILQDGPGNYRSCVFRDQIPGVSDEQITAEAPAVICNLKEESLLFLDRFFNMSHTEFTTLYNYSVIFLQNNTHNLKICIFFMQKLK